MTARPLADAVMATSVIFPQILEEVMLAEHGGEPRIKRHHRLDVAIEKARELVTRLEVAKLAYGATPIEDDMQGGHDG